MEQNRDEHSLVKINALEYFHEIQWFLLFIMNVFFSRERYKNRSVHIPNRWKANIERDFG